MFAGRCESWPLGDGWNQVLCRVALGRRPHNLAQPDASVWSHRLSVLLSLELATPSLHTWTDRRVGKGVLNVRRL